MSCVGVGVGVRQVSSFIFLTCVLIPTLRVAQSLTSVVKLMAKANANLKGLQESTIEVETVANMWKSAYRRRGQDEEHEDDNFHQSSLSLQHNSHNHTTTMD